MPALDGLNREDAFRSAARLPRRVLRPDGLDQFFGVSPWSYEVLAQRSPRRTSRWPPLPSLRITKRNLSQPASEISGSTTVVASVLVTVAGMSARRQTSMLPATMRSQDLPSFSNTVTVPET